MSNSIKQWRKQRGLSQEALAVAVGCSMQTIWRIETGRQQLTQKWLAVIAPALGVAPAELLRDMPADVANRDSFVALDLDAVARTVLPGIETVDMVTVSGDALAARGVLDGDHLMIDTTASPAVNDLVVAHIYGAQRRAKMVARVYDPPYLISYSQKVEDRKPILIDDAHVKIVGVVRGVLRL